MKEKIKTARRQAQNGKSVKGKQLPKEPKLFDTHRKVPKALGGKYEGDNYEVLTPVEHMQEHGNYRERSPELTELKALWDSFKQIQKLRMKINNQKLAEERGTDSLSKGDFSFFDKVLDTIHDQEIDRGKLIEKWVKESKSLPIVKAIMSVKGIGPVTAAALLVYIDITKADHASSIWKYVGYAGSSRERYVKGQMGGGNKTLRCALYVTAGSFLKQARNGNLYEKIYRARKAKLEQSEKIVKEYKRDIKTGKVTDREIMWKDTSDGHRHMDALRVMMKHYLADLWFVWRTIEGLPTNDLYVKEHLGHESAIIDPEKMGWKY